ncbi:hypothetical protein QTO34_005737 [Cnephaeus nilssonii]|uniref:CUB domain-containing protein n=1 Tax=Cnephaeus nilssonii TaxID=3371016 RepID=A0AA40HLD3_CNENI|nr:hypothetical protein QTO34_005737 [Eptesicus nilssonii]
MSGAGGSFSTPRDPASYPANVRCVWEIRVAEGFLVFLTIRSLRLEDAFGCPDFIEVFDGRQRASLSKGRFCAGEVLTFLASSNVLTLVFRSDAAKTSAGFQSLYRAFRPDEIEDGKESDSGRYPGRDLRGTRPVRPLPLREEPLPRSGLRGPPSVPTAEWHPCDPCSPGPPWPCPAAHVFSSQSTDEKAE